MNAAPNVNMGNMGGPVGATPMPMMNNVQAPQQQGGPRQHAPINENTRTLLNTYIYEYFIRFGMNDCARTLLQGDHQVHVVRDGANRRRDENGNIIGNGAGGDAMDTDNKDDMDGKLPEDLPAPKLPKTAENTSFLHEWFCLFWDMYSAQRKPGNTPAHQYVNHTVVGLPRASLRRTRPALRGLVRSRELVTDNPLRTSRVSVRVSSKRCSAKCVPMSTLSIR